MTWSYFATGDTQSSSRPTPVKEVFTALGTHMAVSGRNPCLIPGRDLVEYSGAQAAQMWPISLVANFSRLTIRAIRSWPSSPITIARWRNPSSGRTRASPNSMPQYTSALPSWSSETRSNDHQRSLLPFANR